MTQQQPQTNRAGSFALQLGWFYDRVDFLGFPDLRDKKPLSLDRIYIPLRFEQRSGGEDRITLERLLSQNRRVVVLGDPGAGKSTIVKYVVTMLGRSGETALQKAIGRPIPIPVILRDYQKSERQSLESILARFIELHRSENTSDQKDYVGSDITVDWLKGEMRSGNAFLLFDGLDEVGTISDRQNLGRLVTETIEAYPDCRFLLTSRIVGYEEAPIVVELSKKLKRKASRTETLDELEWLSGFSEIRTVFVAPFQENDIHEFVTRWYEAREPDSNARRSGVVSFRQALAVNDRVRRLASNPSLLTLMALVHRVTANLPSGRVKLYEKIVEAYLETLQSFKKMSLPANLDDMKQWLGRIGWEMQEGRGEKQKSGGVVASEEKLLDWLRSEMGVGRDDSRPAEFLDYVKRRSGLLLERGAGKFAFVHLTFQEYFAAYRLETTHFDYQDLKADVLKKVTDTSWHETLCILLEICQKYRGKTDKLVGDIKLAGDNGGVVGLPRLSGIGNILKRVLGVGEPRSENRNLQRLLATAEFLAAVVTDSENGLNEKLRREVLAFSLETGCTSFNEDINRHLAGMPEQFQFLIYDWFSEQLKSGTKRVITPDFLLTGNILLGDRWARMLSEGLAANSGLLRFNDEESRGTFSFCGLGGEGIFDWSVAKLETKTWFSPHSGFWNFSPRLSEFNACGLLKIADPERLFLAELTAVSLFQRTIQIRFPVRRPLSLRVETALVQASAPALARALSLALDRALARTPSVTLARAPLLALARVVDRFEDVTLDPGDFEFAFVRSLARELQPIFQSENHEALGFFDPQLNDFSPLARLIRADRIFFDTRRFATEGERIVSALRDLLNAPDDWTKIVGYAGLLSLGYGTPELFEAYDALIVKGIKQPNEFTFREDLRAETDSDKFRKDLPELFQLVFTRYPDHPDTKWLVPELFDPKTPGSEWFLAKPPQFREMIEKLAAEKE